MDGRLPDIDYVNMRMGNLLDDDQETLIGSEISVTERLKFKECVKQREKELHSHKSASGSSLHQPFFWNGQHNLCTSGREKNLTTSSFNSHTKLVPSESLQQLTKRIQDLRLRCHWFNSSSRVVSETLHETYSSTSTIPSSVDILSSSQGDTSNEATTPINMPHSYPGDIVYTTPEYLAYTIHMQQKHLLMELALRETQNQTKPHRSSTQKSVPSLEQETPKEVAKRLNNRLEACPCGELDESSGYHSSDNQRMHLQSKDRESRLSMGINKSHWVLKRHPDGSTYIARLSSRHPSHRHRSSHHHPRSSSRKKHESLTREDKATPNSRRTSSLSGTESQHSSNLPATTSSATSLVETGTNSQSYLPQVLFSPPENGSPATRDRRFQPILTVTTL